MKKQVKRSLGLMCLAAMVMTACQKGKVANVELTADMVNMPDTIMLVMNNEIVDTIPVTDGKFSYTIPTDSVTFALLYNPEGVQIGLTAVPGEKLVLTGDAQGDYTMGGSKYYEGYAAMSKMMDDATPDNVVDKVIEYVTANPENEAVIELLPVIGGMAPERLDEMLGLISDKVKNGRMKARMEQSVSQIRERIEDDRQSKELQAEGREAPDFTLKDINGNDLSLSSLRGKYVVLDFWGSWCGWCIKGVPEMKNYYKKYAGKFEILGVDCSDTEDAWKAAVKEHGMPWLHVYNPEGSDLLKQYGIQGFPTKIVLGPDGKIVKTVVGESPEFYEFLDSLFGK